MFNARVAKVRCQDSKFGVEVEVYIYSMNEMTSGVT